MKLIEELVARAEAADKAMGELATNQEAALARKKAYQKIEQLFEQAAGDGQLDENELEELMARFRAAGLDTQTLENVYDEIKNTDATAGVDVTAELREKIAEQLFDARLDEGDPLFEFKAQQAMATYQQSFDLASRVSKAEHDIYMVAIRNLVA